MTKSSILRQSSMKKPKESFVVIWESAWLLYFTHHLFLHQFPSQPTLFHLGSFLQLGKPLSFANGFAPKDGETFQLILQQNNRRRPREPWFTRFCPRRSCGNRWWFGVWETPPKLWVVNGQDLVGYFFSEQVPRRVGLVAVGSANYWLLRIYVDTAKRPCWKGQFMNASRKLHEFWT